MLILTHYVRLQASRVHAARHDSPLNLKLPCRPASSNLLLPPTLSHTPQRNTVHAKPGMVRFRDPQSSDTAAQDTYPGTSQQLTQQMQQLERQMRQRQGADMPAGFRGRAVVVGAGPAGAGSRLLTTCIYLVGHCPVHDDWSMLQHDAASRTQLSGWVSVCNNLDNQTGSARRHCTMPLLTHSLFLAMCPPLQVPRQRCTLRQLASRLMCWSAGDTPRRWRWTRRGPTSLDWVRPPAASLAAHGSSNFMSAWFCGCFECLLPAIAGMPLRAVRAGSCSLDCDVRSVGLSVAVVLR